jgi:hypothetical protein
MEGVWDCVDKSRAMQDPSTQTELKPGGTIGASRLWENNKSTRGITSYVLVLPLTQYGSTLQLHNRQELFQTPRNEEWVTMYGSINEGEAMIICSLH